MEQVACSSRDAVRMLAVLLLRQACSGCILPGVLRQSPSRIQTEKWQLPLLRQPCLETALPDVSQPAAVHASHAMDPAGLQAGIEELCADVLDAVRCLRGADVA